MHLSTQPWKHLNKLYYDKNKYRVYKFRSTYSILMTSCPMDLKQANQIYTAIFKKIRYQQYDVFLCGGASRKDQKSYRDQIRDELNKSFPNYLNILYPEDLFIDMLNRKDYDLLTMEKVLAQNCDLIIIVPESPGSFTELGAFVNNEDTAKKVLVLQHQKYKRQRSFITQGPVSYIANNYKNSILYFGNDIEKVPGQVRKVIQARFNESSFYGSRVPFKDTDRLTGLVYYEVLLLYFYDKIKVEDLWKLIRCSYSDAAEIKSKTVEDVLVKASFTYLYKHGYLKKSRAQYELTKAGVDRANQIFGMLRYDGMNAREMNGLRLQILRDQLSENVTRKKQME